MKTTVNVNEIGATVAQQDLERANKLISDLRKQVRDLEMRPRLPSCDDVDMCAGEGTQLTGTAQN